MRAYAGDAAGFVEWTKKGLDASQHNWEPATTAVRHCSRCCVDGGVQLPGLSDGLPLDRRGHQGAAVVPLAHIARGTW